ncbi:MAG: 3-phosphoshikimate 1-carboxyvinyltransferase [Bacteroidia bacterium]
MSSVVVSHPSKIANGTVILPASKSIANRLLLMRAVAGFSDVEINNLSNARDTVVLNGILSNLKSENELDVHDAGTVMRFLTAYVSCLPGGWILTGTERMQQRPIGALVDVLRKLGADISYVKNEGYPPLKINGKKLTGGEIEIDGSVSSQFLSALVMIAPLYAEPLRLKIKDKLVSVPYVEMTLKLMKQWGSEYKWEGSEIRVENKPYQKPSGEVFCESDWSGASYFYSIVSLAKEGEIKLPYLFKNSLQGDSVCAKVFEPLGVATVFENEGIILKKNNSTTEKFEYNFIDCPDIAQTVAACCAAKGIETKLTGLQTLTVKETDRISAIKNELKKFGVEVISTKDSITIPSSRLATCDSRLLTYSDHRMAMSFAPLALVGNVEIENPAVVEKSFPHYWEELKKLGFTVNEL